MYVANLMRPGVYHPVTRRGEELPPETNLLPLEKDHRFPPHGACFDDQLTRPLHANYCYNTKQRAYTKKIKIGHYVNTTVKPAVFSFTKVECTKLRLKFQNFFRVIPRTLILVEWGTPSPDL